MAQKLPEATKRKIVALAAKGETQRSIAKKFGVSVSSVNRAIGEANTPSAAPIVPTATAAELGKMAPADRLDAQLATIDQVLLGPGVTPAIRARLLTTYSNLLDRAGKMRQRDGKGERQFDGLADLLLTATHADSAKWANDPADWLADAVPRQLPELHEVAGALDRVSPDARRPHAERLRSVLHRILALLDAN